MNGGTKRDKGKPRMDLLDPEFLLEMGRVMEYGTKKYEDRNWEKGIFYSRLYAAVLRHALSFWEGETFDRDSELKALAHVAVNAMMLASMADTWDDRPEHLPGYVFANDKDVAYINVDREDQAELEEYLREDDEEDCAINTGATTIVVKPFTLPTSRYSEEEIRRFSMELWEGKL